MKSAAFVEAARREFLAQVIYYNNEVPSLGMKFTEAVEGAAALAVAFPLAGSPASKSTRRIIVQGFPFSVVYRPSKNGIVVFAVAHHARKPSYWSSRVAPTGL